MQKPNYGYKAIVALGDDAAMVISTVMSSMLLNPWPKGKGEVLYLLL